MHDRKAKDGKAKDGEAKDGKAKDGEATSAAQSEDRAVSAAQEGREKIQIEIGPVATTPGRHWVGVAVPHFNPVALGEAKNAAKDAIEAAKGVYCPSEGEAIPGGLLLEYYVPLPAPAVVPGVDGDSVPLPALASPRAAHFLDLLRDPKVRADAVKEAAKSDGVSDLLDDLAKLQAAAEHHERTRFFAQLEMGARGLVCGWFGLRRYQ